MGNSLRHLSNSSIAGFSAGRLLRTRPSPDKVAYRCERQPGKAGGEGYAKAGDPPSGNQDGEDGGEAQQRYPRPGRADAQIRLLRSAVVAAEGHMREQRHGPGEERAEGAQADHENERGALEIAGECQRNEHSGCSGHDGYDRHGLLVQAAQRLRSISATSERKHQTGAEIQVGHGAGEGCGEHDKVHDVTCRRDSGGAKYAHEWAFAEPDLRPRHDADYQCEARDVRHNKNQKSPAQCTWHRNFWIGGFAGGAANDFDAEKTEKPHDHAESYASPAMREESTMRGVVGQADTREADSEEQG